MFRTTLTKRTARGAAFLPAALCAAFLLASCASGPVSVPEGLEASELVQRAQEASDRSDFKGAEAYYAALEARFGEDPAYKVAAIYELGFIRYRQGEKAPAVERFRSVLALYEAAPEGALPERYRILALKLLEKLGEAPKP